jgi:hypothetical protein
MDMEYANQIVDKAILFLRESIKNDLDYFKHLTTLSTGSILIIIALVKELFRYPKGLPLVVLSFLCFVVSLAAALYMMQVLNGYNRSMFGPLTKTLKATKDDADKILAAQKKENDSITKSAKFFHPIADFAFFAGVTVFMVFAGLNLL